MKHSSVVVSIFVLVLPVVVDAQSSEEAREWVATIQRNTITYSGASQPEGIPLQNRFDAFFRNFYRADNLWLLEQLTLTEQDAKELAAFSADVENWETARSHEVSAKWHSVCADLESLDATTAAQDIDEIENTYRSQKRARYDKLLAHLSNDARASLDIFIDEHVLPGMTVSQIDLVGLAAENPKVFREGLRYRCSPTAAELAAHQKARDELMKSLSTQERSLTSSASAEIGSLPD